MPSSANLLTIAKKWWLPLLICVAIPLLIVGSVIQRHSRFSLIDESAHFDYVERLYSQGIPVFGDRLLHSTLKEISCRGTALEGLVVPPCDAKEFPNEAFPGGAYQYEAQQPPLYYAITAPLAKVLEKVGGLGNVGSARAIGVLWLIGGLLLMWRTASLLHISRLTTTSGIAVVALAPTVVYYSAIVTNDAAGILCGAIVCYIAALTHVRQRAYTKYALLIGAGAALIKISCVVPAVVLGVALLAASVHQEGGLRTLCSPRRIKAWWSSAPAKTYGRTGAGLFLGSTVVTLVWVAYFNITAIIPPKTLPTFDVLRDPNFRVVTILNQAMTFFAPFTDAYQPFDSWNLKIFDILQRVSMYTLIAGCAAGAFVLVRQWWSAIGPLVLAGLYAGGVFMGLGIWRTYNINPSLSGRYALPMVPVLVLILCAGIQRPFGRKVFAAGSFAFCALSTWMIIQTPLS